MGWKIKGQTVRLHEKVLTGTDPFGAPVTEEVPVEVPNVLIGEPSTAELLSSTSVYGKQTQYVLGIPKGDVHDWEDRHVSWTDSHGREVHAKTFGHMIAGAPGMVPGPWDAKMRCEIYGG